MRAGELTIIFIQTDLLQRPDIGVVINLGLNLLRNVPARPGEQQVARVLNPSAIGDLNHLLDRALVAPLFKCKLRLELWNLLKVQILIDKVYNILGNNGSRYSLRTFLRLNAEHNISAFIDL
jgi:hypothetical protein